MTMYINSSNPNPNCSSYISCCDKINKINEKLDNIQFNLNAEKNLNNKQIEERLISLDQKNFDSQEDLYKEISEAKRDLSNLIRAIDEERQQYLSFYNERKKYLNNLEKRLLSKLENEQRERKDMELRLINQIDKNANSLKNELKKENKSRNESIKSFKNYLEEEVPKVIKEMKNESDERQKEDSRPDRRRRPRFHVCGLPDRYTGLRRHALSLPIYHRCVLQRLAGGLSGKGVPVAG